MFILVQPTPWFQLPPPMPGLLLPLHGVSSSPPSLASTLRSGIDCTGGGGSAATAAGNTAAIVPGPCRLPHVLGVAPVAGRKGLASNDSGVSNGGGAPLPQPWSAEGS